FQAEDGIRDYKVTGVQTCALPIYQEQIIRQEVSTTDSSVWDSLFEDLCNFSIRVKELYESDDPVIKRVVVEIIGLNFQVKDRRRSEERRVGKECRSRW